MIWFFIMVFTVGVTAGFVCCSLCVVASQADERADYERFEGSDA